VKGCGCSAPTSKQMRLATQGTPAPCPHPRAAA